MNNGIRVRQIIFEGLMKKGENEKNWEMLCCSNKPLVPFIGAGISAWCYPTWNALLKEVVEENFPEKCADVVTRALDCKEKPVFDSDEEKNEEIQKNFYWMEEIAECIFDDDEKSYRKNKKKFRLSLDVKKNDANAVCQQLRDFVGNEGINTKRDAVKALYAAFDVAIAKESGKIPEYQKLFPKLFSGILVTTNYDKALENSYPSIFSYSYKDLNRKYNPKKNSWLFRAVQAKLSQMQRELDGQDNIKTDVSIPDIPMLLKVHGSIEQANSVALSRANYDEAYGGEMPALFEEIYKNSTLIFMGCSLCEDRILDVMKTLKEKYPASRHFTFYPRPSTFKEEEIKRDKLTKEYGIYPIFYDKADLEDMFSREELGDIYHDYCLGILLENLLRRKMYYPKPLELLWDRYRFDDNSLRTILSKTRSQKLMRREVQRIHVEEAHQIWELLNSSVECPLIAITGDTGSGRSTLCQNIQELSKDNKDTMQFFDISLANCRSWDEFCIQLFQRLNIIKYDIPKLEEWRTLAELVEKRCNGYWRSVLILDHLDELRDTDNGPRLWKTIQMVLGYWKEHQTRVVFTCRNYPKEISCYTWHIGELTGEEARKVFFSACTSKRYRNISFLEQKVVGELFGRQAFQPASVHLLGRYANSKNDLASLLEEWKLYQSPGDTEERTIARIMWFHLREEHGYEDKESEEEKIAIEKNVLWIWGILGNYPGVFPSVFFESVLQEENKGYKRKDLSVKTLIYMKNAGLCEEIENEEQRILLKNITQCVEKNFFSPLNVDWEQKENEHRKTVKEEWEYGLECFRGYSMDSFDGKLQEYAFEEASEGARGMGRNPADDILDILGKVGLRVKNNKERQENKKLNLALHYEIKMIIRFLGTFLSQPDRSVKAKRKAIDVAYSFEDYFHYIPNYASSLVRQVLDIMEHLEDIEDYKLANMNHIMGDIQRLLGKKKEAMEYYKKALDICNDQMLLIFDSNADAYKEALRIKASTLLYYREDNKDKYIERMHDAGKIYERLQELWGIAYYNQCMGEMYFTEYSAEDDYKGNTPRTKSCFERIKEHYNKAAEIYCKVDNKTGIAYILKCMGDLIDKFKDTYSGEEQSGYYICKEGAENITYYVIQDGGKSSENRRGDWKQDAISCYIKSFLYYQGHINWRGFANVLQAMGTVFRSIEGDNLKTYIHYVEGLYGFAEECYRWLGDMRGLADTLDYSGYGYEKCRDFTYNYTALSKWMESKMLWEAQGNGEKVEKIEKKIEELRAQCNEQGGRDKDGIEN